MKSKIDIIKLHLTTPISNLLNKDSIEDIEYMEDRHERMKDVYSLESRKELYNALKWAEQNPNFQFETCLEGTPITGSLRVSNEEVYKHLMRYKAFMENEAYGLLTDDRPTNPPWGRD